MPIDATVAWMMMLLIEKPHHQSPVGQLVAPVNRLDHHPAILPSGITTTLALEKPPPIGGHDEYQAVQPACAGVRFGVIASSLPRHTWVHLGVRHFHPIDMKTILFGNPNSDYWKLWLDDISRSEGVISLVGELQAGFFTVSTPMCIPPHVLRAFADQLEVLDKSLSGSAVLQNANMQSEINWELTALPLGHISSSGRFTINGNTLTFNLEHTDQTQLAPLLKWVRSLLRTYDQRED